MPKILKIEHLTWKEYQARKKEQAKKVKLNKWL